MADTYGSEIEVGPPPVTLRKRRSFGLVGVLALLLIFGAAGGMVWLNLDAVTDLLHGAASPANAPGENAEVLASAPEPSVSAADFTAFQQQTGSSLKAATDQLSAQQSEMRRLSDQIAGLTAQVSVLTAKLDQMPGRAGTAPAAPATAAPAGVAPVAAAPRPAAAAPRRRPADRPAGAISVGGAPLPATPAR